MPYLLVYCGMNAELGSKPSQLHKLRLDWLGLILIQLTNCTSWRWIDDSSTWSQSNGWHWIGVPWVRSHWIGMHWIRLHWTGSILIEWDLIELHWIGSHWIRSKRIQWLKIGLQSTGRHSTEIGLSSFLSHSLNLSLEILVVDSQILLLFFQIRGWVRAGRPPSKVWAHNWTRWISWISSRWLTWFPSPWGNDIWWSLASMRSNFSFIWVRLWSVDFFCSMPSLSKWAIFSLDIRNSRSKSGICEVLYWLLAIDVRWPNCQHLLFYTSPWGLLFQ